MTPFQDTATPHPAAEASVLAPIAFGACYVALGSVLPALVVAAFVWLLVFLIGRRRTPRGAGR